MTPALKPLNVVAPEDLVLELDTEGPPWANRSQITRTAIRLGLAQMRTMDVSKRDQLILKDIETVTKR